MSFFWFDVVIVVVVVVILLILYIILMSSGKNFKDIQKEKNSQVSKQRSSVEATIKEENLRSRGGGRLEKGEGGGV